MIASVADFIRYFESIRRRTWAVVDRVTPDLIDWAPRAGEFTCGEIVGHLAGAERFYVAKVIDDRWTSDLEPRPLLDHAATLEPLTRVHNEEEPHPARLPDRPLPASRP